MVLILKISKPYQYLDNNMEVYIGVKTLKETF